MYPINQLGKENKRILLLNPPGKYLYARDKYCNSVSKASYYWPQIDLLVLSGRLKLNYDVYLLDAIANREKPLSLIPIITSRKYKALIFLTSSASFAEDFPFIEKLKAKNPETIMIGIGGLLLKKGEQVLNQFPFIDAVLLDFTSEKILNYLGGEEILQDMIVRKNGNVICGDLSRSSQFSYPVPLHEQLRNKKNHMPFLQSAKFTVSLTSFGCNFGCYFCLLEKIPFKQRDEDNIFEELHAIKKLELKSVVFHDFNFINDRKFVTLFCERLLKEKLDITWSCQTRVDTVDQSILTLMKRAGCAVIEYGVESGDESVLQSMNKRIDIHTIKKAFADTQASGIKTVGFFMIGFSGETHESMQKTIELALNLKCDYASFSLPMPHPGTTFGESTNWSQEINPEFNSFDDVYNPSKYVPYVDYALSRKMRNLAIRKFYFRPGYILKRITGIRTWFEFKLQVRIFFSLSSRLFRKYL